MKMKQKLEHGSDNQYPGHWSSRIATRALEKIIGENDNIRQDQQE